MRNKKENCKKCAYYHTEYCKICVNKDMYYTKEEKEALDYMCDLMCGN